MSIDDTLAALDRLIASIDHQAVCPRCDRTHTLHPNTSGIARYRCCGQVYDVNLDPPGR